MAKKRFKKRITQKQKELLKSLTETADDIDNDVPLKQQPDEKLGKYMRRISEHQEYVKAKYGKTDKGRLRDNESRKRKNVKTQERKMRKKKKIMEAKEEKLLDKEMWQDKVEFGEVVLRPPELKNFRGTVSKKVEFGNLNFMKQFESVGNQFSGKRS